MDPQARRATWELIDELRADGVTVLTTHFMDEAETLSDLVHIVDAGRVIASGTPAELVAREPRTQCGSPLAPGSTSRAAAALPHDAKIDEHSPARTS